MSHPINWPDGVVGAYLDDFERRQSGPVSAIPTLFPSWNRACRGDGGGHGLAHGWMVVIGANPGFGKTLLALALARDAMKAREKTAFVSMEMHHAALMARFYALTTGVEAHRLEKGSFDPAAMDEVRSRMREMFPLGGLLTNEGILSKLRDVMREMNRLVDAGVTVFLVDYLQIIGTGDEDSINRQVTEAITTLRAFAAEHQVLVVTLSQFNRSTSGNYAESPRAQGLHGGMIIEACADQILLLDHSRYDSEPGKARTWAILDKNRHGPRIEIPVRWDFVTLAAREGTGGEGWTTVKR